MEHQELQIRKQLVERINSLELELSKKKSELEQLKTTKEYAELKIQQIKDIIELFLRSATGTLRKRLLDLEKHL